MKIKHLTHLALFHEEKRFSVKLEIENISDKLHILQAIANFIVNGEKCKSYMWELKQGSNTILSSVHRALEARLYLLLTIPFYLPRGHSRYISITT